MPTSIDIPDFECLQNLRKIYVEFPWHQKEIKEMIDYVVKNDLNEGIEHMNKLTKIILDYT